MEEMLKDAVSKLQAGEVYVEVGTSNILGKTIDEDGQEIELSSLLLAHKLADMMVEIYSISEEEDPCVAGTCHLQGTSEDIANEWFHESDGSLISVLLINKDYEHNLKLWKDFVKPHGVIIKGEFIL